MRLFSRARPDHQGPLQMVTNRCGVIDMSWKGKLELKGPDAIELLEYAVAGEVRGRGYGGFGVVTLGTAGSTFRPRSGREVGLIPQ